MKDLTGLDVLNANDVEIQPVDVPEWGGRVYVRTMSADARGEWEDLVFDDAGKPKKDHFRANLVVVTCCDAAGTLLFRPDQAAALSAKATGPIERLYDAAAKLNKIRKQDVDAEKKDSPAGPGGGSPSASPSPAADPTSTGS